MLFVENLLKLVTVCVVFHAAMCFMCLVFVVGLGLRQCVRCVGRPLDDHSSLRVFAQAVRLGLFALVGGEI